MNHETKTCAVWYVQNGHTKYHLAPNEPLAARYAHMMRFTDTGEVLGVQFDSGHATPADEWSELRALEEIGAAEHLVHGVPDADIRQVLDPFTHSVVDVPEHRPPWLGEPL